MITNKYSPGLEVDSSCGVPLHYQGAITSPSLSFLSLQVYLGHVHLYKSPVLDRYCITALM